MSTSPSLFDLNRLADYALEADELLPLVQILEGDLSRTLDELNQKLITNADGFALHPVLHALKGMAGMFAQPNLHQAIALADDVCRQGDSQRGMVLAHDLAPAMHQWLTEVQGWLRSYS